MECSAYERKRDKNVHENKQVLKRLGLDDEHKNTTQHTKKERGGKSSKESAEEQQEAQRSSLRIRKRQAQQDDGSADDEYYAPEDLDSGIPMMEMMACAYDTFATLSTHSSSRSTATLHFSNLESVAYFVAETSDDFFFAHRSVHELLTKPKTLLAPPLDAIINQEHIACHVVDDYVDLSQSGTIITRAGFEYQVSVDEDGVRIGGSLLFYSTARLYDGMLVYVLQEPLVYISTTGQISSLQRVGNMLGPPCVIQLMTTNLFQVQFRKKFRSARITLFGDNNTLESQTLAFDGTGSANLSNVCVYVAGDAVMEIALLNKGEVCVRQYVPFFAMDL